MKNRKCGNTARMILSLMLVLLIVVSVAACGAPAPMVSDVAPGNPDQPAPDRTEPEPTEPEPEPTEQEPEETDPRSPAEISEAAMENFLAKIEAGNYVIGAEDGIRAAVCSEDLVVYTREIWFDDINYDGFAVMTVNEDETFLGLLNEDGIGSLSFVQKGKALDAAADGAALGEFSSRLPNNWLRVTEGNIWDLFYNDTEEPLRFVSSEDEVKALVMLYADIGQMAMPRMQEVCLTLDAEDPSEAHLTTSFSEGYPNLEDVDIPITFGTAQADPRAETWMGDPDRTYPEAREDWGGDVMNLNAVFLPEYGETAVPFPDFATYAFTLDVNAILEEDVIRIRDSRATKEDLEAYAAKLQDNGFEPVEAEDGQTYYRLLLREEYKCYSSICLEYDDGAVITAAKYYDFPMYEGLEEVNEQITERGFAELPEDENLTGITAVDTAYEQTESWLYFFDYDMVLFVDLHYEDLDAAEAYMESYVESLEDFEADLEEEEGEDALVGAYLGEDAEFPGRLTLLEDEDVFYRCATTEGQMLFKYLFREDGETLSLLFKFERYVAPDDLEEQLWDAGFPAPDLDAFDTCRDFRKFRKTMFGQDFQLELALSMAFETAEEAEEFLEGYIETLQEEYGFDVENPEVAEIDKPVVYTRESGEDLLIVGFAYEEGWTSVNIEFRIP